MRVGETVHYKNADGICVPAMVLHSDTDLLRLRVWESPTTTPLVADEESVPMDADSSGLVEFKGTASILVRDSDSKIIGNAAGDIVVTGYIPTASPNKPQEFDRGFWDSDPDVLIVMADTGARPIERINDAGQQVTTSNPRNLNGQWHAIDACLG